MENPVNLQGGLFFSCFLFGNVLGIFYVLLGFARRKRRFWLGAVADMLFWLVCGPAIFLFLMGLNGGDVRGYLLFAILLGGCLVAVGRYFTAKWLKNKKRTKKQG